MTTEPTPGMVPKMGDMVPKMVGKRPENSLFELLTKASRILKQELSAGLEGRGLSVEEALVLRELSGGGGKSMGALAKALAVNHPTLTKMVDRMVSAALVYRTPDPGDRRRVLIHLTDQGSELAVLVGEHFTRDEKVSLEKRRAGRQLKALLEAFLKS